MYVLVYESRNIVTLFATATTCLYCRVDAAAVTYAKSYGRVQLKDLVTIMSINGFTRHSAI